MSLKLRKHRQKTDKNIVGELSHTDEDRRICESCDASKSTQTQPPVEAPTGDDESVTDTVSESASEEFNDMDEFDEYTRRYILGLEPSSRPTQTEQSLPPTLLSLSNEANSDRYYELGQSSYNNEPSDIQATNFDEAQILDLQRRLAAYMDDLDDIISLDADEQFYINLDLVRLRNNPAEPNYPQGQEVKCECPICLDVVQLRKRLCCGFPACDNCMGQYLETQVSQGIVKIPCISGICEAYVFRDEVLGRLSETMKDRYYKFLVDANKDPKVKTCPRCSSIYQIEEKGFSDRGKYGVYVACPECQLDWCFECHAPWHEGVKCKEFRRGDKLLKMWAKEHHYGHNNAQRCPRCKIFIERKGGCDHMVCSQCKTSFCYRCGERFVELKFFGNHLSRLSPLGCKYNFKPDKPVMRRLIRGSVFGATVVGGIGLLGFGIAAVGVLVGASVVILPAMVGYKYHKYRKRKKHLKRQQDLFRMRTKNALMEMHRERAVLERASRLAAAAGNGQDTAVHVGIQTGQSQQVDVTVHNPYIPDTATVATETNINSEIGVSVVDNKGQITVTTAELSQSSAGVDCSEAGLVLHVKTTYSNCKTTDKQDEQCDDDASGTKERQNDDTVIDNEVFQEDTDTKQSSNAQDTSVHTRRSHSSSSSEKGNSLSRSASRKGKHSIKSRSGESELSRRSEQRRFVQCNSKNGSLTKKHKKGHVLRHSEGGVPSYLSGPDLGDESSKKLEEGQDSGETSDAIQNENLSHSGCFMKLFSKKLNTIQNQFDKEKEKQVLSKTMSDGKDREILDCPDIVSCAIESELKNSENLKDELETTSDKEVDKFVGMVANDTYTTKL